MTHTKAPLVLALTAALLAGAACAPPFEPMPEPIAETTVTLRDGWRISSSERVEATGNVVSTTGFDPSGWTATSVPSTVVAALWHAGEIEDPYFGKNLENIPAEQFSRPWWYRTEFTIDAPMTAAAGLVLEGVNYSADVWLNGRKIGAREDLVGSFRMWELDVTAELLEGGTL